MTNVLNLQPIAQVWAGHMLNGIVEGTALALLAWVALRVIGGENSRARFVVWFSVLVAIGCAPFIDQLYAGSAPAMGRLLPSAINLPESWGVYIFAVWAAISSVALARLGFGLWQLRRLRLNAVVMDVVDLDPLLQRPLEEFQASRPVELRVSERVRVPAAIGFFKPTIILPAWVMRELPVEQVHALLLHELAHLQRGDDWTNLIQKLFRALLFFHPAVWWIDSRLALEREMACDDLVLARTANSRAYAQCLVSVAEKNFFRRGLALAQAAVNRLRHLSIRVEQILGARRPQANGAWRPALSLAVVLSAAIAVSPRAPKLIAFEDSHLSLPAAAASGPDIAALELAESASAVNEQIKDFSHAHLIPAGFKSPAARRPLAKRVSPRPELSSMVSKAQAEQGVRGSEALIPVSAATSLQKAMPREAVFVVIRTQQDEAGFSRSWDVYVIRLTFLQNAQPVDTGASKKT